MPASAAPKRDRCVTELVFEHFDPRDERRRERAGTGQGEAAQGRGAQRAEGGFG